MPAASATPAGGSAGPFLVRMALAISSAAWAGGVPGLRVTPAGVCSRFRVSRSDWVPVAKNWLCSCTWPLTVAPALASAEVTPVTTPPGKPGAVTRTTRCPSSRPLSIWCSPAWAYAWSAAICCLFRLFCAYSASIRFFSASAVFCSPLSTAGFRAVDPTTIPIASARKTATMDTRW